MDIDFVWFLYEDKWFLVFEGIFFKIGIEIKIYIEKLLFILVK